MHAVVVRTAATRKSLIEFAAPDSVLKSDVVNRDPEQMRGAEETEMKKHYGIWNSSLRLWVRAKGINVTFLSVAQAQRYINTRLLNRDDYYIMFYEWLS